MSNIVAGVVRGQLPYLESHIHEKKAIWERYRDGLKDLPVTMNPWNPENADPNCWLSCLLIAPEAMAPHERTGNAGTWTHVTGKSSPGEILAALASFNTEGRPIWKPMHMQPVYRGNPFVTVEGSGGGRTNSNIAGGLADVGADLFARGLCLPSDNKMTPEEQDVIIDIIHRCFL